MIVYDLSYAGGRRVSVVLDATRPNQPAEIRYGGDSQGVQFIRNWLPLRHGAFGHLIGTETTPIDLAYAMGKLPPELELIAAAGDIPTSFDPGIPDGSVT